MMHHFKIWLLSALAAPIDFAVGGQAVIEGVMMRSPHFYTVCVRDRTGKIHMRQAAFAPLLERIRVKGFKLLNIPILRGVVQMVESMALGFKALDYSSDVFAADGEWIEPESTPPAPFWKRALIGLATVLYFVFVLSFTLFLFKFIPLFVAQKAAEFFPLIREHYVLFNLVDGTTKLLFFLAYLGGLSLIPDVKRVFQYHGGEHQSIWTYEKNLPLTVEHAGRQTRFHPRCGTSFLFLVIVLSVMVYTLTPPADSFTGLLLQRIAVVPVVAGLGYEVLKLTARRQHSFWARLVSTPGLWFQRLTTRRPDDAQLEVALHALTASLQAEGANAQTPVLID